MGGRGTLGSRDFKYLSKESVFKVLQEKHIILMKNGKPIKDAKNISNRELSTLSAVAESLNNRGSVTYDIIDISQTNKGKAIMSSKVKKGDTIYRKLTLNEQHVKRGFKHMDSLYKKNGGLKQTISKVTKRKAEPKRSGNPRTGDDINSINDFLAYAKSLKG